MGVEVNLRVEPILSSKRIERTTHVLILSPRSSDKYEIVGTREQYRVDEYAYTGVVTEEGTSRLNRVLSDVKDQEVTVGDKILKASEVAEAISKFMDKWAAEDKAKANS